MSYRNCPRCSFFITEQDEHCPDCGLLRPLVRMEIESTKSHPNDELRGCVLWSIVWLATGFFVFFLVSNAIATPGDVHGYGMLVAILFFLIIVGGLPVIVSLNRNSFRKSLRKTEAMRYSPPQVRQGLAASERTIQERLSEIKQRDIQITAVLERASKNTGEQWESVRQTLAGTPTTVQHQYASYSVKLIEIEMVRWQNALAPLIFETGDLSYKEIDKRLIAIEKERIAGKQLNEKLQNLQTLRAKIDSTSNAQEISKGGSFNDTQELSSRIEQTLASCTKLHDALLSQQAVVALRGVTPLKDAMTATQRPMGSLRELEVFNIQVAITEFSSSFRELEAEYVRVQSEEDVGRQLNQMIQKVANRQ
jgi:hypothetical protein